MIAAAVAALVYAAGREGISRFARRLVYGEQPAGAKCYACSGGG